MASRSGFPALEVLMDDRREAGDRAERLLPVIYDQLRAAAQAQLRRERAEHTLQATAEE